MTPSTYEKGVSFQALHQSSEIFVMPNPWDAGSARVLTGLGFKALATSSFASALSAARWDGGLTREAVIEHSRILVEATHLPVSADLENGLGSSAEEVAETFRQAGAVGLVGGSIEDFTGDPAKPIYDFAESVDRVTAAVEAARGLDFPFTVTGRAENFIRGIEDLDDTIRRLQAYEAVGADVLFAPALPTLDAVKAVCSSVSKPVSFMAGLPGRSFTVETLAAAGVRRISTGTSLYKAALVGFLKAAGEIQAAGSFDYTGKLPSVFELKELMGF